MTSGSVTFIVDENLLRFGRALRHLRNDVACVGQQPVADLLPAGIGDTDWIPIVGDHCWVMITNDRHLRTRPHEADLAGRYKLKVVHLHGAAGRSTAWEQAVRFMSHWRAVEKQLSASPRGPWWLSLQGSGAKVLGFEPGRTRRR